MREEAFEPTEVEIVSRVCWCGEEVGPEEATALGVSFCSACRARMVRSCVSILGIARGPAITRRRRTGT